MCEEVAQPSICLAHFKHFIKPILCKISVQVQYFDNDRADIDNENEDDDEDRLWGGGSLDNLIWAS